ncbi:hypothetical protein QJS10_CPB12g01572 [Acorus calamus]|uniref:Patatin n=1 Tax=Acorus calamus TaxID=4465 RepID=A0AAV9DPL1_ACOCL|nr:hypothetical protein QJS10_CPB12g01572 [Acorus calamus]
MKKSKSNINQIQAPTYGNLITVLSIDGGGIKGIIPAIILSFLEGYILAPFVKIFRALWGPKYGGRYLHSLIREKLGTTRLSQTLTNVIIPAFDVKLLHHTIFSTFEVKTKNSLDAQLSDICIGTSAAPTYFPAHYFETRDSQGRVREFNLIDGGVAANNPALIAIGEVTKETFKGNPDFFPYRPMDYQRFLVISLGTGAAKLEERYSAARASRWGVFGWLLGGGSTPLADVFLQSSGDMVDIHISTVFQALRTKSNYLRIQDDTLSATASSVDNSTRENLEDLVTIGERLLKKPVSRVNLDTGIFEPIGNGEGTNEEALIRFVNLWMPSLIA